jgi:hypothetical protein
MRPQRSFVGSRVTREEAMRGSFYAVVVALSLGVAACGTTTGPGFEDIRVEIQVSGGFAGVSYSFELDGNEGVVRGLSCEAFCDFEPLDVLATVSVAQVERTARDMRDSGILQLDGIDFGTQCCDQFAYVVTYEDGTRTSTVQGDGGTLPPQLLQALDRVHAMIDGRLPIIVALESEPEDFPGDPLTIESVALAGGILEASVTYGGGCRTHEIDLVAFGGWLDSFPVQVNVRLSHEDNDDMCDALVGATLSFDLSALAAAYREAYGAGDPGETTVVLRLEDSTQASGVRLIEYQF